MQSSKTSAVLGYLLLLLLFICRLTEAEFKLDLLEKDPYALDVPVRPFGRGTVLNCKIKPNCFGLWLCFPRPQIWNCLETILAMCMYE